MHTIEKARTWTHAAYGPLMNTTLDQWNKIFDTNVTSAFMLSKEVIPAMRTVGNPVPSHQNNTQDHACGEMLLSNEPSFSAVSYACQEVMPVDGWRIRGISNKTARIHMRTCVYVHIHENSHVYCPAHA